MNIFRSYDNLQDLVRDAFKDCENPGNAVHLHTSIDGGWICADRPSIVTFEGARKALASATFPAGVARLERLAAKLTIPTPISIKRRMVRGDHGDEIDMGRVWQGDLDNAWSRAARRNTVSAARVLVCVFVGALANTEADKLAWRGVAGLALADALEKAGYTVGVRAVRRGRFLPLHGDGTHHHDIDVTIKADGAPLDIHKAASLIASPLLFRGVLLPHAMTHARMKLNGGVTATEYTRADIRDAASYDFTCLASSETVDAASSQKWINETIAALDARNGEIAA